MRLALALAALARPQRAVMLIPARLCHAGAMAHARRGIIHLDYTLSADTNICCLGSAGLIMSMMIHGTLASVFVVIKPHHRFLIHVMLF